MTTVLLGNTAPLTPSADPGAVPVRANIGNTITEVILRSDYDGDESRHALTTGNDRVLTLIGDALPEADFDLALAVQEINDLWSTAHSADPPEWVESDDPRLAEAIAHWFSSASHDAVGVDVGDLLGMATGDPQFGRTIATWVAARAHTCVVGRPEGWTSAADAPPLGGGSMETQWSHFSDDVLSRWRVRELLTNGGRDALHAQHLSTAAQPPTFNTMALANSATATTPAVTDTTLTGEITTAGGGLVAGVATYAHTVGTNTTTLTRTYTANASDALPVTMSQIGIRNTTPTLGYKTALGSNATLSASGDSLAITWTFTGG